MRTRGGIVLLLALLCIVALELTAAALHFAALQQLRAARSGSRGLQLRLSAQSAVALAISRWPTVQALAVPVGGSLNVEAAGGRDALYGIEFSAAAERLTDEMFLIRADAQSPLGERARVGYLVLAPDLSAALATAALRTTASVSLGPAAVLAGGSAACPLPAASAALQIPDASLLYVAPDALLTGAVQVQPEVGRAGVDALLPFQPQQVLSEAETIPQSSARPEPVAAGSRCATDVISNWGEPDPGPGGHPCAGWFPVLTRTGDLVFDGGRGQGILYVSGDLTMSGRAAFSGIVIVAGRLTMREGASIAGVVLSAGTTTLVDAAIRADRCAVSNAMAAVPGLSGPFAPGGRRWIPLF